MFAYIVRFELAYQLRNPVFVVTTLIFFLLTFGAVTIDNIQIGSGGNIHVNSPQAIAQTVLIMTLFYMFASTAFVANVVVRDDEKWIRSYGALHKRNEIRLSHWSVCRCLFGGSSWVCCSAFAIFWVR